MLAAATCSRGAPERFLEQTEINPSKVDQKRLQATLLLVEVAQTTALAVEDVWEDAFFWPGSSHRSGIGVD